ncbi:MULTISPECIES: DUF4190 domain-containing protein [Streptomyces]|uniref:DUF4190 domain-containing protein n=1 Tax=Streptomyces ramulosus TaxID=47762 RepID=A0ABW1FPM7_9ACTN
MTLTSLTSLAKPLIGRPKGAAPGASPEAVSGTASDAASHSSNTGGGESVAVGAERVETASADGMAVASFVLGLLGTLVFNVVLGPCALVLGTLALARRTRRRGRAVLGLALGAADLIILAVLTTADATVSWHLGG